MLEHTTEQCSSNTSSEEISKIMLQASFIKESFSTRFINMKRLDSGAFGTVYAAYDTKHGTTVAIKRIDSAKNIKEIQNEVEVLKNLNHDSIIKYHESFISKHNVLNIVMEYANGGSLSSLLAKKGPMPEVIALKYIKSILIGIDFLHSRNIIHRDIKAANVLLLDGEAKLADFGLAYDVNDFGDQVSIVSGSPNWMAPEVLNMHPMTTKSDIWSIGALVIELLTGKPPFSHLPVPVVLTLIKEKQTVPIPENISESAKQFIMCCIERKPSKRPTAADLLHHSWFNNFESSFNSRYVDEMIVDLKNSENAKNVKRLIENNQIDDTKFNSIYNSIVNNLKCNICIEETCLIILTLARKSESFLEKIRNDPIETTLLSMIYEYSCESIAICFIYMFHHTVPCDIFLKYITNECIGPIVYHLCKQHKLKVTNQILIDMISNYKKNLKYNMLSDILEKGISECVSVLLYIEDTKLILELISRVNDTNIFNILPIIEHFLNKHPHIFLFNQLGNIIDHLSTDTLINMMKDNFEFQIDLMGNKPRNELWKYISFDLVSVQKILHEKKVLNYFMDKNEFDIILNWIRNDHKFDDELLNNQKFVENLLNQRRYDIFIELANNNLKKIFNCFKDQKVFQMICQDLNSNKEKTLILMQIVHVIFITGSYPNNFLMYIMVPLSKHRWNEDKNIAELANVIYHTYLIK